MQYSITKTFDFSAAHQLAGLPEEHPCSRLHGHNYIVKVELVSDRLNQTGFVYDYRALNIVKDFIDLTIDHRNLNDIFAQHNHGKNTTAENLAAWIYGAIGKLLDMTLSDQGIYVLSTPENLVILASVAVSETPKTWAEYRPVL